MPDLMLSIALPELHDELRRRRKAFYDAEDASRRARARLYVHAAAHPQDVVGMEFAAQIADTSEPVLPALRWEFSRSAWLEMVGRLSYADVHQALAMPGYYEGKWQPLKLFQVPVQFTNDVPDCGWRLV